MYTNLGPHFHNIQANNTMLDVTIVQNGMKIDICARVCMHERPGGHVIPKIKLVYNFFIIFFIIR